MAEATTFLDGILGRGRADGCWASSYTAWKALETLLPAVTIA
jgi:hypothetical protein